MSFSTFVHLLFHQVVDLLRNLAVELALKAVGLYRLFKAVCAAADISAPAGLSSRKVERNFAPLTCLSKVISRYISKFIVGSSMPLSGFMSIFQPVSLAARRAF